MAKISCPNCGAQYNVPDEALGPAGRKVSCASCGQAWHATIPEEEPLMLLSDPEPASAEATAPAATPSEQPASANAAPEPEPQPDAAETATTPEPETVQAAAARIREERAKQLAEIRQIVDEVQSTPTTADPAPGPISVSRPAADAAPQHTPPAAPDPAPIPVRAEPEVEPADLLRREAVQADAGRSVVGALAGAGATAAAAVEPARESMRDKLAARNKQGPDTDKSRKVMMRKHTKRAKKRADKDKRGNGLFFTGFLLVVLAAAILIAIYVFAGPLTAQMPGMGPALADYVAQVDAARVGTASTVAGLKDWVVTVIGLAKDG